MTRRRRRRGKTVMWCEACDDSRVRMARGDSTGGRGARTVAVTDACCVGADGAGVVKSPGPALLLLLLLMFGAVPAHSLFRFCFCFAVSMAAGGLAYLVVLRGAFVVFAIRCPLSAVLCPVIDLAPLIDSFSS